MKKCWLFTVCAVLFMSCRMDDYYYLSEPVKQLMPYRLGEEVRFTNGSGDQITLTAEKLEEDWWCFSEHTRYSWFQCNNMQLRSKTGLECIDLKLGEWQFLYKHTPYIDLVFPSFDRKLTVGFDLEGNLTTPKEDSVLIGGRMYHDVAKMQAVYRRAMNSNKIDTLHCYYSKTYGVLQAKYNDKVFLERLP